MTEEIKIMKASPEDVLGILDVLYKTWLVTYPNKELGITVQDIESSYENAFLPENIEKRKEKITQNEINEKRLVAKCGDQVVGMAMMVKSIDKNQLRSLYVLPEFQVKKIGFRLWSELKDFIDPNKDTTVELADYNQQAINFYKKLGFVDTGRRWIDEKYRFKSGSNIPQMEMIIKAGNL